MEQLDSLWPVLSESWGGKQNREGRCEPYQAGSKTLSPCHFHRALSGVSDRFAVTPPGGCGSSPGESRICERVFEARYKIVEELRKMGADITVTGEEALVRGRSLQGAALTARELRGGAAVLRRGGCGSREKPHFTVSFYCQGL